MDLTTMAQKQMTLARKAQADPAYRFTNLYDLLHWDPWIRCAADTVLARPGSSTAGVDHTTRAAFNDGYEEHLGALIAALKRRAYVPQPVRRAYVPKRNGKMRPLGIPALRDRIVQEALRAILDPIFESDFQPHSYGFRKGRCTMDAIAVLMPLFNERNRHFYVIEGDIKSYFDTVQHRKLLSLLKRRIADRGILDLLWAFLKAGVMEGGLFARTEAGVPQGGIISPLLANVYLNEFDTWAERQWHLPAYERQKRRNAGGGNYTMVRYADDFVVVSNDTIAGVQAAKQAIKAFLASELHLELSDEKTMITHVNDGFDFLGFHVQRREPEGRWVVHLRPTDQSKDRVKDKVKALTTRGWTWLDEYTRLTTLNAIVRGWAEYYRHTSLLEDIEEITRYVWHRYLLWLCKKHKGSRKHDLIQAKTQVIHNRTRWTAQMREGERVLSAHQWLPTPAELRRCRYFQKGRDGFPHPYLAVGNGISQDFPMGETGPAEHLYTDAIGATSTRSPRHEPLSLNEVELRAKIRDNFKCTRCGATNLLEVHHRKGTKSHRLEDLQTLCLPCHHAVHNAGQTVQPNGEPDVAKVTCPVR